MTYPRELVRTKYGANFAPLRHPVTKQWVPLQDWKIEAEMYARASESHHPPGWLGKAEHFMRMITCIFASPAAKRPFQWNPNAVRIVKHYFENNYLAIAGHGSSSKTETIAIIALGEFLVDPENTAILVTSTTLNESRQRIWGRIEYYWQDLCEFFGGEEGTPGQLISSSGLIRYKMAGRKDDTRGIKLVPGKESELKEGMGRMKGFKAPRMRFLADELSDLSHKIPEAAISNLNINDDFKMVGGFNPSSHFDPAGLFAEPIKGWGSIDVLNSDGWQTKQGYCIRFDALTSPNVLLGRKVWEGLMTCEKLKEAEENLGRNSPRFMEQYRGAWSETGHADGIYSEAEILKYMGMEKVKVWANEGILVGGFDPSFTHGGDRSVLVIGRMGRAICFEKELPCIEVKEVLYLDDDMDTSKDKKELVIERLKKECQRVGLDPKNLAMDATGGGDVLATLMSRDPFFSTKFMKVQFGAAGADETSTGGRKYVNMVSELWYSGKPLLRCGQIRGLKPEIVREMTLRLYEETSGGVKKIRVESKEDMKKRLNGRSCDTSDAFFLMVHVCRARLALRSDEKVAKNKKTPVHEGPLAHLYNWGVKKKFGVNADEHYVAPGGGWADDGPKPWFPGGL